MLVMIGFTIDMSVNMKPMPMAALNDSNMSMEGNSSTYLNMHLHHTPMIVPGLSLENLLLFLLCTPCLVSLPTTLPYFSIIVYIYTRV